jgi:nicotinate-nucleotide pyrophosphorylase (carboxylating)
MAEIPHDPIGIALAEDIGTGDLTAAYFVPENQKGRARIVARQGAVVAGVETAAEVFERVDRQLETAVLLPSGSRVEEGDAVLEVRGLVRSILSAERVALNFLQHLSGVATLTDKFVAAVRGSGAQILDTRKTTPGLRALEKAAVKAGGGKNHRFGLFDMILVKDNHLAARSNPAFLREAIQRATAEHPGIRIEVEADRLEQVKTFLEIDGIDVILLDNMPDADMREAVLLAEGAILFEASGGITLDNVARVADTGVDFISIGALTHSAPSVDFSLELLPD